MCDAWPFSCWRVVNQHQSNTHLPHPAFECIALWPGTKYRAVRLRQMFTDGACVRMDEWMVI
jgi:hypothetical protein